MDLLAAVPLATVFVYGTLKTGQLREPLWPHRPLRVEPAVTSGRLYDLGPYPALVDGLDPVLGELWYFPASQLERTLRVLDAIEHYGQGGPDLYVRELLECCTLDGRRQPAHLYRLARRELLDGLAPIPPDARGLCCWPTGGG